MKYSISAALLAAALPFILAAPTPEADAAPSKSGAAVSKKLPLDTSVYLTNAIHALNGKPTISKRSTLYGVTANELGKCAPVTVIFARGTIELGNIGELVGPFFADALAARLGSQNVGVQGVQPYSASFLGYFEGGDPTGSKSLAALTEKAASQCPHTQIVLSGYSQGAQLVHNGATLLKPTTAARVKAVVLFGDPYKGRPIQNISPSIVDTFCFATDLICYDTIIVDPAHLAYSIDAVPAANFVASKVKV